MFHFGNGDEKSNRGETFLLPSLFARRLRHLAAHSSSEEERFETFKAILNLIVIETHLSLT
jgi:hypothetical protein